MPKAYDWWAIKAHTSHGLFNTLIFGPAGTMGSGVLLGFMTDKNVQVSKAVSLILTDHWGRWAIALYAISVVSWIGTQIIHAIAVPERLRGLVDHDAAVERARQKFPPKEQPGLFQTELDLIDRSNSDGETVRLLIHAIMALALATYCGAILTLGRVFLEILE